MAADIGHYLASFALLNITSNGPGDAGQLIAWQEVYVRAPYELVREVLFLAFIAYGLFVLARGRRVSPL